MLRRKFERVVETLTHETDKNGDPIDMFSIIVSNGKEEYSHYFKERDPVDIRSIAKPIACLAIGAAIDHEIMVGDFKLSLDMPVWPLMSKYCNLEDQSNLIDLQKISIHDCLKITLGHSEGIMFSADIRGKDESKLIDYVINYPIQHQVGRYFQYSNAGTFIISTLITEYLDMNLDELTEEYVFKPLGISTFEWRKFGKYTCGCTGLKIQNMDLHKIGQLILNDGVYDGKQIISSSWVKLMKTPQVQSPTHRFKSERAFPKWSYGLNLWLTEEGNYYCDGTNSQYLIVIPSSNLVITTIGNQKDSEPVSSALGLFK